MRIFVAVLGLSLIGSSAHAQPGPCGPWLPLQKVLEEKHKETTIGGGIVNALVIIEVLASQDGKSFTIVSRNKNGMACILAVGKDWNPGLIVLGQGT